MNAWWHITLKNNVLHMDNVNLSDLVAKYSTPLYVVSSNRIIDQYKRIQKAFGEYQEEVLICFAYKANTHLAVCKTLSNVGCGADVVSEGELDVAIKSDVPASKIVFNGNNKTVNEIELASKLGILMVNVDSASELNKIQQLKKPMNIAIRVNPNIDAKVHKHVAVGLKESKFGINIENKDAINAYKEASEIENISIKGIHCHIGSQITTVDPFITACERLIELMKEIKDELSIEIEYLNLGGGLGVPYKPNDQVVSPETYAAKIIETIHATCKKYNLKIPKLILEPGRYLVADSTVLLGQVGTIKKKSSVTWASLDTGMTHLMRPVLYDAYHEIQVVNDIDRSKTDLYSISGPCCESGDFLAKNRELPVLSEGDTLAIYTAGAYGFTLAHNYNVQYKPNVVMIHKGKDHLIREKENFDDLYSKEKVPNVL